MEKKSERLDVVEFIHNEFSASEKRIADAQTGIKGKQDNLCSNFKNLKEEFGGLSKLVTVLADSVGIIKMQMSGLEKKMDEFTKSTQSIHAGAIERSKKQFEDSIKDIRKKLEDYCLEGINADIKKLGDLCKEIIDKSQRHDSNFQIIDKRLSNINLNFVKQNSDKKE